ncbi:MAG: MFS transporter [Phycisphaerales bacterium JB054]
MPPPPQAQISPATRRDLRLITVDGLFYCLMVGCGEAYFGAFAIAMGMHEILAGLIGSVPLVVGGTLQLVTPVMVRRLGSLRRWVVLCATIQACSFLPLAMGAYHGSMPAWLIYLAVSLYWTVNYAQGPAWNTWVATLVPDRIRARYFARRTRIIQLGTVVGLLGAGTALNLGKGNPDNSAAVGVFVILFLSAAAFRFYASRCLAAQSEPEPLPRNFRSVSPRQFLARWRTGHDARLLGYMLLVQIAVQTSGPFFTPFMLVRLELSYATYMVLIAVSFVSRMVVLPFLGRLAQRRGPRAVLLVGGLGLIPASSLWAFGDNFWYLLAIQAFSGAVWAAYELATFLLLFDAIPSNERTSVLSMFNFANTLAIVIGSLAGATLLGLLGEGIAAYHTLFIISSGLRVLTIPLLLLIHVRSFRPKPIELQPMSVRPGVGAVDRPVLAGVEDDAEADASREGEEVGAAGAGG